MAAAWPLPATITHPLGHWKPRIGSSRPQQPELELKALFDAVAREAYNATTDTPAPQIPVRTHKLTPAFYFRPAA
jgi:hypothetical protein